MNDRPSTNLLLPIGRFIVHRSAGGDAFDWHEVALLSGERAVMLFTSASAARAFLKASGQDFHFDNWTVAYFDYPCLKRWLVDNLANGRTVALCDAKSIHKAVVLGVEIERAIEVIADALDGEDDRQLEHEWLALLPQSKPSRSPDSGDDESRTIEHIDGDGDRYQTIITPSEFRKSVFAGNPFARPTPKARPE